MSNIRAITVSVNYSDCLAITLPYVRHHFSEYTIVTTPADAVNVCPIADANDARVLTTDLFTYKGASFAKWLALEWGLSQIGRKGWLCLLDADVLWPKDLMVRSQYDTIKWHHPDHPTMYQDKGQLFSPLRRMYPTIPRSLDTIPPEDQWSHWPVHRNVSEFAGYSQCFHADDPVLGNPPWHQVDWMHCGGADSFFQAKWPQERKIRPSWSVLHLGEAGQNWCGRSSTYADGSVPPDAQDRRERVAKIWQDRRGKKGMEAFKQERYDQDVDLPSI